MMAGNYIQFALFVTLQISIVLCRSTGAPDNNELIASSSSPEIFKAEALKETVAPGTMLYDVYINDESYIHYHTSGLTPGAIVGIIFGVISFFSLILGCILVCVCKKKPRRGHIVNLNSAGQTGVVQQTETAIPGVTQTAVPMQQYPSSNQQIQNQNIYPTLDPSN